MAKRKATDYVEDGNGIRQKEKDGNGIRRERKGKVWTLLRFIRPMFWGLVRGAGGSVPRVCEVEGRLCTWTLTQQE